MKITLIGAGNMGGALLNGLAQRGEFDVRQITVVDTSPESLERWTALGMQTTRDALAGVADAEVVILAVKPWVVESVAAQIGPKIASTTRVVSIAAGVGFDKLAPCFVAGTPLFRVIPNTAAAVGASMTFVASQQARADERAAIVALFEPLGEVMEIPEHQIAACTALASCGIAYALRYIRAAVEGGVELGVPPLLAQHIVTKTVQGAAALLLARGTHPEAEIDQVTTPGGYTIKGLNAMEANGFTHAVIEGLKASGAGR